MNVCMRVCWIIKKPNILKKAQVLCKFTCICQLQWNSTYGDFQTLPMTAKMAIISNKTSSTSRISLRQLPMFRRVLKRTNNIRNLIWLWNLIWLCSEKCYYFRYVSRILLWLRTHWYSESIPACFTHQVRVNKEERSKRTSQPNMVLVTYNHNSCFHKHDKQQHCLKDGRWRM